MLLTGSSPKAADTSLSHFTSWKVTVNQHFSHFDIPCLHTCLLQTQLGTRPSSSLTRSTPGPLLPSLPWERWQRRRRGWLSFAEHIRCTVSSSPAPRAAREGFTLHGAARKVLGRQAMRGDPREVIKRPQIQDFFLIPIPRAASHEQRKGKHRCSSTSFTPDLARCRTSAARVRSVHNQIRASGRHFNETFIPVT